MMLLGLGFLIGLVVVYDTFVIVRAFLRGSEVAAASEPFQAQPPGVEASLLVVGDSTARGTGSRDPALSIAGRMGSDFPRLRVDNLGTNGALTREVVDQLGHAPEHFYSTVLVQVGGNDALRFTSLDGLARHIDAVLALATDRGEHVALMSTGRLGDAPAIPWPISRLFTWRAQRVREIFDLAARRHGAHYVDLFSAAGTSNPFAAAPEAHYARDGLHPSGEGYGVWYEKLREQVPIADWFH